MNNRANRLGALVRVRRRTPRRHAALLLGAVAVAGLTAGSVDTGVAWADDAAPAAAAPVAVSAGAGGPSRDAFDPTMRAAVALVLVGLFAATRPRANASR